MTKYARGAKGSIMVLYEGKKGEVYHVKDIHMEEGLMRRLQALGLNATVRRRLGADISAACGQLRRETAAAGLETIPETIS